MVFSLIRYLHAAPNSIKGHRSELTCSWSAEIQSFAVFPRTSGRYHQSVTDGHNAQKAVERRQQLKSNTRAPSAKFSQWTPGVATATAITDAGVVIWESIPWDCNAHDTPPPATHFLSIRYTGCYEISYSSYNKFVKFIYISYKENM
jgi:hypothetical protein